MTAWTVSGIHRVDGGWSWEIARDGVIVLGAAEPIRNPATCAITAERFRRDLAAGRIVLDEDGNPFEK